MSATGSVMTSNSGGSSFRGEMNKGEILEDIMGEAVDDGGTRPTEVMIDLSHIDLDMGNFEEGEDAAGIIEDLTTHDQTWFYSHGLKLTVGVTTFFFNRMITMSITIFAMYNLIYPVNDESTAVYISLLAVALGTTYKQS